MIMQSRGKCSFMPSEICQIEDLLQRIRSSKRRQQLLLRKELRSIGFYIINYTSSSNGFTVSDFRRLIEQGLVKIMAGEEN